MPYIVAALVIVVLGIGFTIFQSSDKARPPQETTAPITEQVTTQSPTTATYKDGTYETKTTYQTPVRSEYMIDVTLVLVDDIIADTQIIYSQGAEKDPNAAKFEAAYRTEVIGKNIDTLNLSRVGGASLTTGAFNKALASIKTDAKSKHESTIHI